jgi:hypothetical protein
MSLRRSDADSRQSYVQLMANTFPGRDPSLVQAAFPRAVGDATTKDVGPGADGL